MVEARTWYSLTIKHLLCKRIIYCETRILVLFIVVVSVLTSTLKPESDSHITGETERLISSIN